MRSIPALLPCLLLGACAGSALRAPHSTEHLNRLPRAYICHRATAPIAVDGRLAESAWSGAPWTEEFRDIEGEGKPLPRHRTRAKMLWDDEYFYIGATLEEPHVWATLTEHDAVIFHDNDFEVFIDPDGDAHLYYELEINALGTEWDLLLVKPYKDGGPALNQWEIPGLQAAVHICGTLNDSSDEDRGWSVELALPWSVLAVLAGCPSPPREGDRWRVNFSRVEWQHTVSDGRYEKVPDTREDNWVWSPQGVIDMHRPEHWGYVQFTSRAPGAAGFVPDPARPAHLYLQALYAAQQRFRAEHERYASSISELGIAAPDDACLPAAAILSAEDDNYTATIRLLLDGGGEECWHIRQDARLWRE